MTATTITAVTPIVVSCAKDPNMVSIPNENRDKYQQIIKWFNEIALSDLDIQKFPQELSNFKQDEYYDTYLKKWNFGADDFNLAKEIDEEFIFNKNKGFYKKIQDNNLLNFFNRNFKIRLRVAKQNLNILLNISLIPISEYERVKNFNNRDYFLVKYYDNKSIFLSLGLFNLEIKEKSKELTTFELLSYIIPPLAIIAVIIYIVVAIQIKKRKQKRR
ncbi:hypothetical protein DA803_00610 [[Mycoplasma] phocae]|uniref:Uncharacterized protein n=2 Tax=[Mycoplasma] phocae TaxID=142651 RepID=A0A2Z5IPZ1_9BACT|nr:hypothetical protein DA803_00610 [[Mycoplasma] phocae]